MASEEDARAESGGETPQIEPEDIRMKTGENGPILEIGDVRVGLHVGYYGDDEHIDSKAGPIATEKDHDGDFSWWLIYPEDDLESPYMEVTPEILEGDGYE